MTLPSRTWMSRPGRFLWLIALVALAGCAATRKQDILESRLRHQEDMLSSYQVQLDRAKTELDIVQRESASLRTQLAEGDSSQTPREHIDASFRAAGIEFSTLMTGGSNVDDRPGDDGLTVVLVPQGPDGELVKVPGTIEIEAFDLSHPSGAQRIGHWQFDASESHRYWHKGVIQSGYQFQLPWQDFPQSEKLLLHGRLVSVDGRQFDTTHTIRIDPPDPALARRSSSAAGAVRIEQVSAASGHDSDWLTDGKQNGTPSHSRSDSSPLPVGHTDKPRSHSQHDARSLTGKEFTDRLRVGQPLRAGTASPPAERRSLLPLRSPSRSPAATRMSSTSRDETWRGSVDAEIPPAILNVPEDADRPEDDDWSRQVERPPVRTSDSWTDTTLPYLR